MSDSPRVLVVEDDPATQSLLSKIAQREGFVVIAAGDGADALVLIAQRPIDLILLDLLLPKVDGFAIMKHLRETNLSLLERTIVITAASDAATRDCEELAYVASFRRKPTGIMDIASDLRLCAMRMQMPSARLRGGSARRAEAAVGDRLKPAPTFHFPIASSTGLGRFTSTGLPLSAAESNHSSGFFIPVWSIRKRASSVASASLMRMQPCDAAYPIESSSFVPWM